MSIADYKAMQRRTYDELAATREGAEHAVHPRYKEAASEAYATLAFILNDYSQRRSTFTGGADIDGIRAEMLGVSKDAAILDFGCGVGRLMEALVECRYRGDGVDISPEMLGHARSSEKMRRAGCNFYISGGDDCGDAPRDHYDLAYSLLCFQHICVHTVRESILTSLRNCLKPNGVVCIQVQYFPITLSQIPEGHAAWQHDKTDASASNSSHDVWLTPEALPTLLADFAAHFADLRLQFVNLPTAKFHDADGTERSYQHLFISGSKTNGLEYRIYRQS